MNRGRNGGWTVAVTRVIRGGAMMMIRIGRIERSVAGSGVHVGVVLAVVQIAEIVFQLSGFVIDQLLELCDDLQLLVAQLLGSNQRLLYAIHCSRLLDSSLAPRFLIDRATARPLLIVKVDVAQMS